MAYQNKGYEEPIADGVILNVPKLASDIPQSNVQTPVEKSIGTEYHGPCSSGLYAKVLTVILDKVNLFFEYLTTKLVKHPYIWIGISLMVLLGCSLGVLRYNKEIDSDFLYAPVNSESDQVLEKTKHHFLNLRNTRHAFVILEAKNGNNFFEEECIKEGKDVAKKIMSIPKFYDICLKKPSSLNKFQQYDKSHNCTMINPFELISNNSNNTLYNIDMTLNDTSTLMSNGKTARDNKISMLGTIGEKNGRLISIGAVKMSFSFTIQTDFDENLRLEKEFIKMMEKIEKQFKCVKPYYYATRSFDDSAEESVEKDLPLLALAFVTIIVFSVLCQGRFNNPIRGHSILVLFGVFCTGLGIAGGMGLAMAIGTPYVSIAGIVPFLVLSIGVDDMFIVIDEFDSMQNEPDPDKRIVKCMRKVGATITMTTLTDIAAFAVGISSKLRAIRYLCTYAAITFAVEFFAQITLFVVLLSFDANRINSNRRECLPCWKAEDKDTCSVKPPQKELTLPKKVATILVRWPARIIILTLSALFIGGGIYGCIKIKQDISPKTFILDDSYVLKFLDQEAKHFGDAIIVDVSKIGIADYSDKVLQEQIRELPKAAFSTDFYQARSSSWLEEYLSWAKTNNLNVEGANFTSNLPKFLSVPEYAHFLADIKFNKQGKIIASQIQVYMKISTDFIFKKDGMLKLREEFKKRNLDVYAISELFPRLERIAAVIGEIVKNALSAGLVVLVITLPFCISPVIVILMALGFVILMVQVIGVMYFWDLSIHGISMVNLVVSVGFAVDYSAHVAHSFLISKEPTADERVIDALSSVGVSVLKGGLSTFFGILTVWFAISKLFTIFFRMFFAIILFGLFNGLLFLPVIFSILGFAFTKKKSTKRTQVNQIQS